MMFLQERATMFCTKRALFTILLLLTPSTALKAGGLVNNGGKVVVCAGENGSPGTIRLFDYYEAKMLRDWDFALGDPSLPVQDKVDLVLSRLESFDGLRAEKYRLWSRDFWTEAEFLTSTLPDVPDQEPVMDPPEGCTYSQIIIQRRPVFSGDKRYFVNKKLFESSAFSADQKAGLILHEVIYREAIEFGAENSIGARYLNTLFSADQSAVVGNVAGYFDLLKKAGFKSASTNGVWIDLTKEHWFFEPDPNRLRTGDVVAESLAATKYGTFKLRCTIQFDTGGLIKAFSLSPGQSIRTQVGSYDIEVGTHIGWNQPCDWQYDVIESTDSGESWVQYNVRGWLSVLYPRGTLSVAGLVFFNRGRIEGASIVSDDDPRVDFVLVNGQPCPIRRGAVELNLQESPSHIFVKRCVVEVGKNSVRLQGAIMMDMDGTLKAAALEAGPLHRVTLDTLPLSGANPYATSLMIRKGPDTGVENLSLINHDIAFYKNGTIASLILAEDANLLRANGEMQNFLTDNYIRFDEQGRVTSSFPLSR